MVGSRVYVGRLPYGVRERDLEKFFKKFGKTRDILLKNGYGFVEFEDFRDADDAVYELNGKELLGERIVVEPARGIDRSNRSRGGDRYGGGGGGGGRGGGRDRFGGGGRNTRYEYGPPTRTDHRLIVENLSSKVNWQDLKDYMRQAGEVSYADAHRERKNEGVVEFVTSSDMRAALEKLDGTDLSGRRIRLVEDRRGGRGGAGGGGARRPVSRSGSRSRSRSRTRRSRSRSHHSSRSRSRSKSPSRQKSKSPASKTRDRSGSRQAEASKANGSKVRSRTRSRSPSRSRSRSRSGSAGSRNRSRDRSPPPRRNDGSHNSGDD